MPTETKHTPGPWSRNIAPATKYPTIFAGRNTHVACLVTEGRGLTPEQVEANADLIARAPELLERAQQLEADLAAAHAVLDGLGVVNETHEDGSDLTLVQRIEAMAAAHDEAIADLQRDVFDASNDADSLRQDAERYRWLRNHAWAYGPKVVVQGGSRLVPCDGDALDVWIDADIAEKGGDLNRPLDLDAMAKDAQG